MRSIELFELMVTRGGTVDPRRFPGEIFDLYSIPAFDRGASDLVHGTAIGSAKQVVRPGDVLLSKIVPHVRRSWVVGAERDHRLIASGEWIVFRHPSADARYLHHVLVGDPFHRQFMATVSGIGGSLLRARPAVVAKIEIPLPAIEEQRRIADILDRADALRAKRREALAHLDDLTESIFLDMFGEQSHEWPTVEVVDLVDTGAGGIRTGPFGSQLLHSEFVDDGIAVLGIDNAVTNRFAWAERRYITQRKYAQLSRYTVHPGDVLITIMGTCGRAAIVPDDVPAAINSKHLCCISLDKTRCLPEYLHAYFLRHPVARDYLARTAKGAIMSGLNMGIIKAMPVSLPPPELQTEFVTRLRKTDRARDTHRTQLVEIGKLFASLQQQAFAVEL